MPPYNGHNPAQIIQEYYATVNNSAEVIIQSGAGAVALADDLQKFFPKLNASVEGYSYPSNCIHTQGLDLNQVSESGLYFCSSPVNAPSSICNGNGFMIAITYAGKTRGMQLYMPVGEDAIYKRQNTNETWEDWGKIKAGSAETAVNKGGDTIPGRLNFIRDSAIRFITPDDVTGGHARGIYFLDKNGTDIWGGIGAIGNGGILEGIYLGIGSTYPWSTSNSLYITESSIKWKNSNLVTENSGNALSATRATQDGNGNVIADTYARKKWVYLGNAGKGGGSFSYDVTLNGGKEFLLVIYIAPINDDIGFFETHYIPYDVFTETAAHTNGIVDYSIKVDNENVYNGSKVNVSFNRGGFLFTNNTGNCDMKVYVKK